MRLQHGEEARLCKILETQKINVKEAEANLAAAQDKKRKNIADVKQKKAADEELQSATIALAAARLSQTEALQDLCAFCGKDDSTGGDSFISAAIPSPMPKGRPAVFTEATFAACMAEFKKIQTGIKDGVSQDYLVKMLLKKRQELQSGPGEVLAAPETLRQKHAWPMLFEDSTQKPAQDPANLILERALWRNAEMRSQTVACGLV